MKYLLSTILSLFLIINLQAQTAKAFNKIDIDQVPNEALKQFADMHPNTPVLEWRVEGDTYEAKYKSVDFVMFDRFNPEGLFLETRILKDWKSGASDALRSGKNKTTYKYWDVIAFYEVTTADKDVYYVVMLESENSELQTLYFDEAGTLDEKSKSGY